MNMHVITSSSISFVHPSDHHLEYATSEGQMLKYAGDAD
jgi:hypothetical protein